MKGKKRRRKEENGDQTFSAAVCCKASSIASTLTVACLDCKAKNKKALALEHKKPSKKVDGEKDKETLILIIKKAQNLKSSQFLVFIFQSLT